MKKIRILLLVWLVFTLVLALNLASAYVIRNVTKERQAEWDRFEQYKEDYIEFNDLEGFEKYVSERNLAANFGFYSPSRYYVPPDVWAAKYAPPLQGDAYYTDTRGYDSSLYHLSAIRYYGQYDDGRYSGYIPADVGGIYFDHPQMNGAYGYITRPSTYGRYSGQYYGQYNDYDFGGCNSVGCGSCDCESAGCSDCSDGPYYARVADSYSGGYYIVRYY